jgi:hypothetical protein
MWRRVDIVLKGVSVERIASIFTVEKKNKSASEPVRADALKTSTLQIYVRVR